MGGRTARPAPSSLRGQVSCTGVVLSGSARRVRRRLRAGDALRSVRRRHAVRGRAGARDVAQADGVSAATIPTMSGMVIALAAIPFSTQLDRMYKERMRRLETLLVIGD